MPSIRVRRTMPAERRAFVLCGAVVALVTAVGVLAVATPAPHGGGDNAGYLSLAHALASGAGYTELWEPEAPSHTKYPPAFPLLLGAGILAGASTWMAFKLLMAMTLSVAVLLVFAWASGRVGPVGGAAVAILTLVSSGWLEASRWVLSEPPFLVFTFLALWAIERSAAPERGPGRPWIWIAGLAAIMAFFTRSAGLPLVLALGGSLLLGRRRRAAAAFAACLAVPGVSWFLRARSGGAGAYQSEFWLADPYQPELGTVGWLDLPVRAWANLRLYVGNVLPGEWWPGAGAGLSILLGAALVGLAGWGWFSTLRRRPGTAELFVPLYLGLILVWPEVWSGDRFILPLYPLILLYAGEAITRGAGRVGRAGGPAVLSAAFLLLFLPAFPGWLSMTRSAAECRRIAERSDPIQCHGPGFQAFRDAAVWSGANLPEETVVLTRKPRIFYLFGGPAGRTFPFTQDADRFLAAAESVGADYVLLDEVDRIGLFYIPRVIAAEPGAFCHVAMWGSRRDQQPGTILLRILGPGDRIAGASADRLAACPGEERAGPANAEQPDAGSIPRLRDGD